MASRGVNKVIVVGNLGNDPEIKYTNSGSAIARLSIATSEQWTDKNTNQKQERTEWHRVVFFGRLAEICGEYLRKGSQVFVEGSLRTEKYTDKEGIEKYSTDIIGREMQMLGARQDSGANQGSGGYGAAPQPMQAQPQGQSQQGYNQSQSQPQPMQQPAQPQNQQPQQHTPAPTTDFDDDIPF